MPRRPNLEVVQFHQRILELDPIALWIQDEKQGAVAYDWVTVRTGGARNGAYTGVTLGQPGVGFGRTSPFYDGANDYTNIWSANFAAAFDGAEGTFGMLARVANVGVWKDATFRVIGVIRVDNNNRMVIRRSNANNRMDIFRIGGGITSIRQINGLITTEWFFVALTWSEVADEVRVFYKDVTDPRSFNIQQGATINGLGAWVGAPVNTLTLLGAETNAPLNPWHGYIQYAFVSTRAMVDEMAYLANSAGSY